MGRIQETLNSSFQTELKHLIQQEVHNKRNTEEWDMTQKNRLTLPRVPGNVGSINLSALRVPIIPIADWTEVSRIKYSKNELTLRNKLAALYRLADFFHWSQGIYNHITVRVTDDLSVSPEILINPFGLLYQEITACSLVKIDLQGRTIDSGSTKLGINQAGYVLHSAIHEARPKIRCVLHLHTPVVAAVSAMKCGLLPICQEAMILGPIAYHDYQGIVSKLEEKESIVQHLGKKNVMILRNHGFVVCGESVEDALHLAFHLILACQTQIRLIRAGLDNIIIPEQKAVDCAYNTARHGGGGVIRLSDDKANLDNNNFFEKNSTPGEWQIGELEWEAWMRVLDSAGMLTGHLYRLPVLKVAHCNPISAGGFTLDVLPFPLDNEYPHDLNLQIQRNQRLAQLKKKQEKNQWINSPNNYQKVEFVESITDNAKVLTKWVSENNSNSQSVGGTPIKINSALHFTPSGTNPEEFKMKQQELKKNRSAGALSGGPQSQVFDGMAHKDILNAKHEDRVMGCTSKDYMVTIGTASKGIITRDQQQNAQVYRQIYAPNPFVNESDVVLKNYIHEVKLNTIRSASPQNYDNVEKIAPLKTASTADFDGVKAGNVKTNLKLKTTKTIGDKCLNTSSFLPMSTTTIETQCSAGNQMTGYMPRSKSTEGNCSLSVNQSDWVNSPDYLATLPFVMKNKVEKKKSRKFFLFGFKKVDKLKSNEKNGI